MPSSVLRIAMNGITGRMGYRQHLLRSILPIRDAGGIELADGTRVQVEPILVGRNEEKVTQIARQHQIAHWSTDVDAVIADPSVDIYFDAQVTSRRGSAVAGLNTCVAQQRAHTPMPLWNPDLPVTEPFRDQWLDVPANADLDNGFKLQREEYLRDVVAGRQHRFGLLSAARGVQLAELGLQSSAEGRRLEIPAIAL